MVTNAIQKTSTDIYFGEMGDISVLAQRIKTMMRGGEKLSNNDAMALAQVAAVTHLDPFIGEIWWIPGSGAMVGIAGARRLNQEATKETGGYSWPSVVSVSPEEAGAAETEVKDVVAAFRVEINNSAATAEYQKMFSATLESMRSAGVSDPFSAAKEVCGPRPMWVGYGFAKRTDQSRMSKTQLARKRAEADALKKCVVIPFGAQVAEIDVSPDYIDAEATDAQPKHTQAQNLQALGFDPTPDDVDKDFPPESKAMPRPAEAQSVGSMTFEEAQNVVVSVKNRKVKVGDMTKEQLEWVIQHTLIQANADAAGIVLAHDYPPVTDGDKVPDGQLL